jgi:hypothetical protein
MIASYQISSLASATVIARNDVRRVSGSAITPRLQSIRTPAHSIAHSKGVVSRVFRAAAMPALLPLALGHLSLAQCLCRESFGLSLVGRSGFMLSLLGSVGFLPGDDLSDVGSHQFSSVMISSPTP